MVESNLCEPLGSGISGLYLDGLGYYIPLRCPAPALCPCVSCPLAFASLLQSASSVRCAPRLCVLHMYSEFAAYVMSAV